MMNQNVIVSAYIDNNQITTISGAKIGDSESRIRSIYPNIKKGTGFYGTPYLIYEPQDRAYEKYFLLFEIPAGYVKSYRVSKADGVFAVEGCS